MEKHFLLAVSDNLGCLYGARFLGYFFLNKTAVKITLFYVIPRVMENEDLQIDQAWRDPKQKMKISGQMEKSFSATKKILCRYGFQEGNINEKIVGSMQGKVKDIVEEGHSGKYDAVVLGRRGAGGFEAMTSSSVSENMLEENIDFPLWLCRQPEEGRKNVLLCIDGSDGALRMADHVGFMLAEEAEHGVTVFHVNRGQQVDMKKHFALARQRLLENGVPEQRISEKTVNAIRVTNAIFNEVERNRYAVVATGLVGRHYGSLKGWFIGGKSLDLARKIDMAVVWTCR